MGADSQKLPDRVEFEQMLETQLKTPLTERGSYVLIWELDGKAVSHSNHRPFIFGKDRSIHLHLWNTENQRSGVGTDLLKRSMVQFFERLELDQIVCKPCAVNAAPNCTSKKVGFEFVKAYRTVPGSINFEQEVNQWVMSRIMFEEPIGLGFAD